MAIATVPVTLAAVPVVFWLSVGISAATTALNVGTPAEPLGAAKNVLAVWLAKFDGKTASVPPKVKFPLVVTVPLKLRPLTVPVPPTEVTVPVVLDVPAPMAVRKSAAFRDETVLSALKRGNVIALGFVIVNRFEPSVVAPSAVRAAAAVVEPVPPLAMAKVPAKVIVPLVVMGPPLVVNPVVPPETATLVTVPVVLDVPAPMAVLKVAASSAETVLSAFTRKKVMAAGFVRVNKFEPTVVAPKFVRAVAAVVAPVPPLAMATVPVTFAAVPVVFWFSVGTSAATKARNVGTPAEPFGAARTVLAVWLAKLEGATASVPPRVIVPVVVIGPPVSVSPLTVPAVATDVTVPVVLDVPAPIAVRNAVASSVDTVLSALKRGNAIAATFANV